MTGLHSQDLISLERCGHLTGGSIFQQTDPKNRLKSSPSSGLDPREVGKRMDYTFQRPRQSAIRIFDFRVYGAHPKLASFDAEHDDEVGLVRIKNESGAKNLESACFEMT